LTVVTRGSVGDNPAFAVNFLHTGAMIVVHFLQYTPHGRFFLYFAALCREGACHGGPSLVRTGTSTFFEVPSYGSLLSRYGFLSLLRKHNAMCSYRFMMLLGLLMPTVVQAVPISYQLDPGHTNVLFSWDHFGFSNPSGSMQVSKGTLVYDEADPAKSSVEVSLSVPTLTTFVPKLDEHLKGADFFNAAQYPTITFKSTRVEPSFLCRFKSTAHFCTLKVTGNLTVHGVTKPVVLKARLNKLGEQPMLKKPAIGFDATATLQRSMFGMAAYVPYVSDDIKLRITTEASAVK
jgi:polyisoprenoid-binding protein YceI